MKRKKKRNGKLSEMISHRDVVYTSDIKDEPGKNGSLMALTVGNENRVDVISTRWSAPQRKFKTSTLHVVFAIILKFTH